MPGWRSGIEARICARGVPMSHGVRTGFRRRGQFEARQGRAGCQPGIPTLSLECYPTARARGRRVEDTMTDPESRRAVLPLRSMSTTGTTSSANPPLLERLRAATETLELIAADRGTLALLSEAEHRRLREAAALVCNPDVRARRTMAKALARRRKRERSDRDDGVLAGTGIRALRRQPVFTTPNVFAPRGFLPRDLAPAEPRERRRRRPAGDDRPAALLHLQAEVLDHSSFLRPAVPVVR